MVGFYLISVAIGLGMIVIGAALGIGKFAAAAAEGIARQPSAADKITGGREPAALPARRRGDSRGGLHPAGAPSRPQGLRRRNRHGQPVSPARSGPVHLDHPHLPGPAGAAGEVCLEAAAGRRSTAARRRSGSRSTTRSRRSRSSSGSTGVGRDHPHGARRGRGDHLAEPRGRRAAEGRAEAEGGAEADDIVQNAERQIQLETGRALQQIRREAVDLSVMIASKIIQRNITQGRQRAADRRCAEADRSAPPLSYRTPIPTTRAPGILTPTVTSSLGGAFPWTM